MSRTPVLLAWSGGKDAAWTLHLLRQRDDVDVVGLLTTVTREYDRVSMQGIRRSVLHAPSSVMAGLRHATLGITLNASFFGRQALHTGSIVHA